MYLLAGAAWIGFLAAWAVWQWRKQKRLDRARDLEDRLAVALDDLARLEVQRPDEAS